MDAIAGFCDTRSLRSSRDLLWDMFFAALSGEDAQYTGRQAGEWALLYRQLDALMQAAWELNKPEVSTPVILCVRG
jgi:hypothetical protein